MPKASLDLTYCLTDNGRKEPVKTSGSQHGNSSCASHLWCLRGGLRAGTKDTSCHTQAVQPSFCCGYIPNREKHSSSIVWCQKCPMSLRSGFSSSSGGWIPLTTPKLHGVLNGTVGARLLGWGKETVGRRGLIWTEWKRALCIFMGKCVWKIKR